MKLNNKQLNLVKLINSVGAEKVELLANILWKLVYSRNDKKAKCKKKQFIAAAKTINNADLDINKKDLYLNN